MSHVRVSTRRARRPLHFDVNGADRFVGMRGEWITLSRKPLLILPVFLDQTPNTNVAAQVPARPAHYLSIVQLLNNHVFAI